MTRARRSASSAKVESADLSNHGPKYLCMMWLGRLVEVSRVGLFIILTAGLRPLLNLSQTCFLSAVLQALIHNPLLRAYFLSDKHNRHVCTNGSRDLGIGKPYLGPDGAASSERDKGCMCCELDRAFEEVQGIYQPWLTSVSQ